MKWTCKYGMKLYISVMVSGLMLSASSVCAGWVQDNGTLNVDSNVNGDKPSLAVANNTPYVAWVEDNGTADQIYVKRYVSGSWTLVGTPLNVGTSYDADEPSLAFTGSTPYVAWCEYNGTAEQLYVKRFVSGNWDLVGTPVNVNTSRSA